MDEQSYRNTLAMFKKYGRPVTQNPNAKIQLPKSSKYGLSAKILQKLFIQQKYECAICRRKKTLVLDHDHKTNKARGYLCYTCNTRLSGLDNEKFKIAAEKYLKNPPAQKFYK